MISEYGGEKINREQAQALRKAVRVEFIYVLQILNCFDLICLQKLASHVITVSHDYHLDSRENLIGDHGTLYDMKWFAGFHYMAAFANAELLQMDANAGFTKIDAAARPGHLDNDSSERLFLYATEDIYNNEEIFTSYGHQYFAVTGVPV
jgi:hypothetical protein